MANIFDRDTSTEGASVHLKVETVNDGRMTFRNIYVSIDLLAYDEERKFNPF